MQKLRKRKTWMIKCERVKKMQDRDLKMETGVEKIQDRDEQFLDKVEKMQKRH